MSHAERRSLRQRAAGLVRDGRTCAEVAGLLGRSRLWVYDACTEFQVEVRREMKGGTYVIIADLINTNDPCAWIAQRAGVSVSRVQQVLARCREFGIKFPHRPDLKGKEIENGT
jgi:transposase